MDDKKIIKKETVQRPTIKKVVKNETVYALDENKNLILKDISTIEKDLQIEDSVEFKISEKRNNLIMNSDVKNLDESINEVINDGIVEIQAEVMEDEENVKKEKKSKSTKTKKQQVEETIPEIPVKIDKNEPVFTEQYKYKEENVVIIKDKPSTPLIVENYNSNKKQYESYLNTSFKVFYNGVEIYDNDIASSKIVFEDEYFILYGKNYSYKGFRIKIK